MRYRQAIRNLSLWCLGCYLGTMGTAPLRPWFWWLIALFLIGTMPLKLRPFAISSVIFLIAFGYAHSWRRYHWREAVAKQVTFEGTVIAPPDIRSKTKYLTVRTNELFSMSILGSKAPATVLVSLDRYDAGQAGDTVQIKGTGIKPEAFDSFNYPLFLERDHIFTIVRKAKIKVIQSAHSPPFLARLSHIRGVLEARLSTYVPEPEGSFLAGLLFGSKRAIPSDITTALQATSTSHLVAISGANITFIVQMALSIIPVAHRWGKALVVIVVAGSLTLLTGGSASVTRGAVIAITNSIVTATGRRAWPAAGILLAASLMLATNPLLIRADPGFQLSFAAYGGLLIFSTLVSNLLTRLRFPQIVQANATETIAATLGTAPLSVVAGSFAARGLIVNPLVLWLIPPATSLGFLLLIIPFAPLAKVVGMLTWGVLHISLGIITLSSKL